MHDRNGSPLALFISDLHLQAGHARTSQAFFDFLAGRARGAQALYVLGDLFEYWAGDDDLEEPFHLRVAQALRAVSDAGVRLFWIAGNRDFLVGARFAEAAGMTLLTEPHVASFKGQRIVLLHGDAECTDDTKYMAFRAMVRAPAWQQQFLSLPLPQRKAMVQEARQNSRADQREKSDEIMDVAPQAIAQVFAASDAEVMIHGHTHRPAVHAVGATRRYVLPDWDLDTNPDAAPDTNPNAAADTEPAPPARGGWIAVDADGVIRRYALDGSELA